MTFLLHFLDCFLSHVLDKFLSKIILFDMHLYICCLAFKQRRSLMISKARVKSLFFELSPLNIIEQRFHLQTVPQYSGKSVSCNSHSTELIFMSFLYLFLPFLYCFCKDMLFLLFISLLYLDSKELSSLSHIE